MADDVTLQARISELPAATKTNDTDLFEVSQGGPAGLTAHVDGDDQGWREA